MIRTLPLRTSAAVATTVVALALPAGVADAEPVTATVATMRLDLDAATIPDLQTAMDGGALTAVALTRSYLDRIDALDPELAAVIALDPHAVAAAAASDLRRSVGGSRGPLDGIPVLVKDNVDVAGLPTTAGSRAMTGTRPDDAELVRNLRAAGAVVLGKTNLSEWANFRGDDATSGWSAVGGQTANPYVLDRNPCGSSAGSAVAVAASLAQVAVGTETNGSLVCPASATGVVGVKPGFGTISGDGTVPISTEQDTAGPLARHTVDAAILLDALAGTSGTAEALDDGSLAGRRIGVWRLSAQDREAVGADTAAVFDGAVAVIEAAGATAVPVELPDLDRIGEESTTALTSEFVRDLDGYLARTPGAPADLDAVVGFNAQDPVELAYFGQETMLAAQEAGTPEENPDAAAARVLARKLAQSSIDGTLAQAPGPADDLDAVVALTGTPAWRTRYDSLAGGGDRFVYSSSLPAAVAGYPSVAVPAGFAGPRTALPVGVSFIGAHRDEAGLLSLAYAFEQETHARRAPGLLPTVGG